MDGLGGSDEEEDASEVDSDCGLAGSQVSDSHDSDSEDISGFESRSEQGDEVAGNAAVVEDGDGEQSSDVEEEEEAGNGEVEGARCSLCMVLIDLDMSKLVALPDKWCDGIWQSVSVDSGRLVRHFHTEATRSSTEQNAGCCVCSRGRRKKGGQGAARQREGRPQSTESSRAPIRPHVERV